VASLIDKLQLPLKVKLGSSTIVAIAKQLLCRYFVFEHEVDTGTVRSHGMNPLREESPE
jgi:hypothetical protein